MKNDTWEKGSRIIRQVLIYNQLAHTYYHGPSEIKARIPGLTSRMLQRDLQDLKDAGLINIRYSRSKRNYIDSDQLPTFNESVTGRRRSHLIRLKRLCTLLDELDGESSDSVHDYLYDLELYEFVLSESKKNPEEFPPSEVGEKPEPPDFMDARKDYHARYPDCSDRTMQRDFRDLNETGLIDIHYSRKLRIFLVDRYDDYY
ncbi:MAG: hypothetical protein K5989_03665 [Lachnospiraceae bacterium]|nr:hypothetical protein [Lachnospiraceae bacterium]